jgi:phosphoenolpyruvate carboxylase
MSTQHPDNVGTPFFTENSELGGEDEIREAYYAFSHLGMDEQMWDCEGKEVDNFVVKKLLTRYESFFRQNLLGRDVFITLRVPNPTVEKSEAKILLETLESIPRSFDAAKLFYGKDIAPIFEVILPMTASAKCMDRVYRYYSDFVVGKKDQPFRKDDITIAEWIGDFMPERINVIPLFEDMQHMLRAATMVRAYLQDKSVEHQRVFLARSDPAMNYGMVSAALLNKIALRRLDAMGKDLGVRIYPVIGAGSAPFRGNLKPGTAAKVAEEYPSAHTFTLQSAFKYDNTPDAVKAAARMLHDRVPGAPQAVDEDRCLEIIRKYTAEYQKQMLALAPLINGLAKHIPSRRKRKLHTGLFGYSRSVGEVKLPRVITFTCALYSIGLPPEILGLNALDADDLRFLKGSYVHFEDDLRDALRYFNPDSDLLPKALSDRVRELLPQVRRDEEHSRLSGHVLRSIRENKTDQLEESIVRAASLRGFLG